MTTEPVARAEVQANRCRCLLVYDVSGFKTDVRCENLVPSDVPFCATCEGRHKDEKFPTPLGVIAQAVEVTAVPPGQP